MSLLVAEMLNQDEVYKICERYFMKKSLSLWYPTYVSPYKVKMASIIHFFAFFFGGRFFLDLLNPPPLSCGTKYSSMS